jgi:hypothetical protein
MLIKFGASFAGINILGTSFGTCDVLNNVIYFSPSISVVPIISNVGVIGLPSLSVSISLSLPLNSFTVLIVTFLFL